MCKIFLLLPFLLLLAACQVDSPPEITGIPRTRGIGAAAAQTDELYAHIYEETTPTRLPVLYTAPANPAMYETFGGIYTGAWLGSHTTKREFVAGAGTNQAVFVYEYRLGEDFPATWLLQSMAMMATPLFTIHQPLCDEDETPIGEHIAYFAKRLGSFRLPAFVAFYPAGSHNLVPAEYSLIFRYARALFLEHAPLAAFVWVATDATATRRNPFFPGHDAVDWVGVPLFARRDANGFAGDVLNGFEHFYSQFHAHHPIMVLPLGVSHLSRVDYVYSIEAAADEIMRLYHAMANFPRVGLVVYADAFGLHSGGGQDDFAISIESELIAAYRQAIHVNDVYVNLLVKNSDDKTRLVRHNLAGYYYNGIFIDTEILSDRGINVPRATIDIGDRTFVDIERVPRAMFCERRQVIFIR